MELVKIFVWELQAETVLIKWLPFEWLLWLKHFIEYIVRYFLSIYIYHFYWVPIKYLLWPAIKTEMLQ